MENNPIPSIDENPDGLHRRYIVEKVEGLVDPFAEYFVLRLDLGGSDPEHIAACRQAIYVYADAIKYHLPKLSKDLIDRYGDRKSHPVIMSDKLERIFKEHENVIHTHYSSFSPEDRFAAILGHYKHDAAKAIADRKETVENTLVYFRSVLMLVESIGMGGTHREKDARLRGLVQLLDQAIHKLRKEQTEGLLDNWLDFGWGGRSEYPYRDLLEKAAEAERDKKEMQKQIDQLTAELSELKGKK